MTTATVLRLTCKRRAISRRGMPSWWSRKIALRLSASIMELFQPLVKGSRSAQDGCREQIGLGVKGPAFEPRIPALANEPLHILVDDLQIAEHRALKLAAPVRILERFPEAFEGQGQIAVEDLLAERVRPTKIAMSQLLNFPYAKLFPADSCDELLNILAADSVHAHELAQGVHVGVDREGAAKELDPDRCAHLRDESQAHADPGFTARKLFCHLGHAQAAGRIEFVDERRLLQDAQGLVVGNPQKVHDSGYLVLSQRSVRHAAKLQLVRTAIPLETVEQNAGFLTLHSFEGFLDAPLGNRDQEPFFEPRIFHPVALITQIQTGKFNLLCHVAGSQGGCS